jgi:hypothetical protein
MADVQELAKLSREQLNQLGANVGLDAQSFPNKEALATELSDKVTDEQLAALQTEGAGTDQPDGGTDPNNPPADAGGTISAEEGSGLEGVGDVEVDDHVFYPYKDSQSGYRRGRVTEVYDGGEVEVVWADGSRRSFSKEVLKADPTQAK